MDILPSQRSRALVWAALLSACLMVLTAGASAAAIRYEAASRDRLLNGVTIGGLDVGGLTVQEARETLMRRFEAPLDRPMNLTAGDKSFAMVPRDIGAKTDAMDRLAEAQAAGVSLRVTERLWYLATGRELGLSLEVKLTFDDKRLTEVVGTLAEKVDVPAQDATVAYEAGELVFHDAKAGAELQKQDALKVLADAILNGATAVSVPVAKVAPEVTRDDIRDVILVKVNENKLYHYREGALLKTYNVATGTLKHPTPRGNFKIINKRKRPTWVNPAKFPGGWGYSLPARIGPGPGNPLGTRALDINSPGIRIHGTYANHSLGYNASHGCIRMSIAESEELFDLVPVGTPVIIVREGPYRPLSSRAQQTQPEPSAENDGSRVPTNG